jgi:hypothetical protein
VIFLDKLAIAHRRANWFTGLRGVHSFDAYIQARFEKKCGSKNNGAEENKMSCFAAL